MGLKLITLTTDFGTQDAYAGSLHGVILNIEPQAQIVAIAHQVPPYDIAWGAFVIGTSFHYFPRGTIHIGVVDPGVGGERLPILIQTENYFFVGPDNGLFSLVAQRDPVRAVYHLKNEKYFRPEPSHTFHGRDIFAPVAAHLAAGVAPERFGPKIKGFSELAGFALKLNKAGLEGRVIHIDQFGNAITNITRQHFAQCVGHGAMEIIVGRKRLGRLVKTYSAVPVGRELALFGSHGLLELACYQASLAKKWRLKRGQKVVVKKVNVC